MVIVTNISSDKIKQRFNNITKIEFLKLCKGIKSNNNETEDEYLERTKDIIIKFVEIKNIFKDEDIERFGIKCEFNNELNIIMKNEKEDRNKIKYKLSEQYHQLQNEYHYMIERNHELVDKNNMLCSELFHLQIELNEYRRHDNNDKTVKIMNIPTKRLNQCYECGICNETIFKKEVVYDTCHTYHIRCLTLALLNNDNCPYCRKKLI